ncbi:Yip1 family protein [uncultured Maritimibacter sp.]|uniref:Yip1 family protein n=1 Tax=uncultured Maritimibacter sp. TaxID=991866 RepID=UPI002638CAD5|nr:Yip1 family protein [uncultured Maritimibacter sp.]
MRYEPGYIFGMALQSIPEPRRVARDLFDQGLPRNTLWAILALILVLGAMLGVVSGLLFPIAPELEGTIIANPMLVAVAEASIAVLTAFFVYWVSRAAGGTGSFEDGLVTVIWVNFVLLMVQTLVLILTFIAPGLAVLLWIFGSFAGIWIMSHFIAEAHGFTSAGRVFLGVVMTGLVAAVVLSVVLTLLGVMAGVQVEDLSNV